MAAIDRWPELLRSASTPDGLQTRPCGPWTEEKLYFWHRYLEITTAAMVGNPKWSGGLVYVDLFSGPGVCEVKDSGKRLPGSPILAANAAKPFRKILLSEIDQATADACSARMRKTPAADRFEMWCGDANEVVSRMAASIPPASLTLAFIDPEHLGVEFSTLETLANKRAVDFLLLFADATDLVRNVDLYEAQLESKLDRMLGPSSNWRVDWAALQNRSGANVRALFPQIYERQIQRLLGYEGMRKKTIRGPHGPMYTLLYASKHPKGLEFWDKITKKDIGGQQTLGW